MAGYTGTAKGARARTRLGKAKAKGIAENKKRGLINRLKTSDVIFFSGHHYGSHEYNDPGDFGDFDLKDHKFTAKQPLLIIMSSCTGIRSNTVRLFNKKFPNAYILGWRYSSPDTKAQCLMTDNFLNELPADLYLETEISKVLDAWKKYIEKFAEPNSGVRPQGLGYATPTGKIIYYYKDPKTKTWSWKETNA